MHRFYGFEVKFLWWKDDRASFIVGRYIEDSFEKKIPFLLLVCGTGFMRLPPVSPHIAVTKPAMKTSGRGTPFLRLDLRRATGLSGGIGVLLTLDVRVPGAGGKIPITGGAEDVDSGIFEFGSMATPPNVGFVSINVLTNQPTALAELDQVVSGAICTLASPCRQK